MAFLFLAKRHVESVFQLLGHQENDMTYSLGWALSQCKTFLGIFLKELLGYTGKLSSHIEVRLQQYETEDVNLLDEVGKSRNDRNRGLTDIEIEDDSELFIILEAKAGATSIGWSQIEKYYNRKSFTESKAKFKYIVTLNENKEDAQQQLRKHLDGERQELYQRILPYIKAISWSNVSAVAVSANKGSSHDEKRLLRQFTTYLSYAMRTSDIRSNKVLVILKKELPGTKINTKEFIAKHGVYIHPFGENWPRNPTNYIAFTDRGKLNSIHWVKNVRTMTNPERKYQELLPSKEKEFLVYELGEKFAPSKDIRVGKISFPKFIYCMLDTLFTEKTIADARNESKLRERP